MAKFKKGQVANPKGCPKGAHHIGRPAEDIRTIARKFTAEIMERVCQIALGGNLEQVVTDDGETIAVPANANAQLKAAEIALNYDIGKPSQSVELTGADGSPLSAIPTGSIPELIELFRQRVSRNAPGGTGTEAGQ